MSTSNDKNSSVSGAKAADKKRDTEQMIRKGASRSVQKKKQKKESCKEIIHKQWKLKLMRIADWMNAILFLAKEIIADLIPISNVIIL